MPRSVQWLFGVLIATLLIGGPLAYISYRTRTFRNFRVVRDDVLYRSGQMSLTGLKQIVRQHGIKTVITLRDAAIAGTPPPDIAEEEWCRKQEINHHRITPRLWWAPDNSVPAAVGVRQFLAVMDDPRNYPVLIHCFAGTHRTGAYVAVYRMEYEGWSNQEAIDELRSVGYDNLDEEWDILSYLESYKPRKQRAPAK